MSILISYLVELPALFVVVQSPIMSNSATSWTAGYQASQSTTISWNLPIFTPIELVMPSNHLILCPLFIFCLRYFPALGSFPMSWLLASDIQNTGAPASASTSPSNEYSALISFRIDWLDLLCVQGILKSFPSTTVWKHQFFSALPSLWSYSHIHTWLLERS